jgi:tRNA U34 5-carboxymethylaminomethyl modifying GTPase MnmE/TrmE
MKTETNDIIVALATAHGSSAIAIIRLKHLKIFFALKKQLLKHMDLIMT